MNIQKLEIKGFKSIAHVSLENISPFLVFAGANGAGKSNLVDALVFLGAVGWRYPCSLSAHSRDAPGLARGR